MCICIGKHRVDRIWYYLCFQVSTDGLKTYPAETVLLWIVSLSSGEESVCHLCCPFLSLQLVLAQVLLGCSAVGPVVLTSLELYQITASDEHGTAYQIASCYYNLLQGNQFIKRKKIHNVD